MQMPQATSQLPLALRAAGASSGRMSLRNDGVTCFEPVAAVLQTQAGSIALVRRSKVTSVEAETTDDS